MKTPYLILLLTSLAFIQSCSSYNVKPISDDITWKNGKGFVKSQNENLVLQVAVDYTNNTNQSFLVEVENTSSKDLLLGPEEFFVESKEGRRLEANNPEVEIAEFNRQIEYQKAILDTTGVDLLDSALGLTLTLADRKDASLEERVTKREKEQVEAKNALIYLEKQKLDLEITSMRKKTVPPKGKLSGVVKFSNELAVGNLNIILKNIGNELVIPFQVIQK